MGGARLKNVRIRHLRVFQAIMVGGSATSAGELLGLTQPAISRSLSVLEAELGFALFERRGRHLHPSSEGRRFYREITPILGDLDNLAGLAEDIRLDRSGPVRIAAIGPLLFSQTLPLALRDVQEEDPSIRFAIDWVDRLQIEEAIANQRADLGVTLGPINHPALGMEELATVQAVAVFQKGHPFATQAEVAVSDLRDTPLILPQRQTRLRQLADSGLLESPTSLSVMIEASTAVASCHMASVGLGVALSDPFSATGVDRNLVEVRPWRPKISMTYTFIWPNARPPTDRVRNLMAAVRRAVSSIALS